RIMNVGPDRLLHLQPMAVGLQAPFQHPLRLVLLLRDHADDFFVQTARNDLRLDLGDKAVFVFPICNCFDCAHFLPQKISTTKKRRTRRKSQNNLRALRFFVVDFQFSPASLIATWMTPLVALKMTKQSGLISKKLGAKQGKMVTRLGS